MSNSLEKAEHPEKLRRVVIEPVSRVEGHGKVTILLDEQRKVHPLHEVVKVDYYLPGCPPSADAIWKFLTDLIAGRTPHLGHGLIHYD